MDEEERQLRARFSELRENDARAAPAFEGLTRPVAAPRGGRVLAWAAAAVVAVAAGITIAVVAARSGEEEGAWPEIALEVPAETGAEWGSWESPTEVLLVMSDEDEGSTTLPGRGGARESMN